VAPDMRGYNWSSKPPAVEQYRIEYLVLCHVEIIGYSLRSFTRASSVVNCQ
jgi:hypothetical protein